MRTGRGLAGGRPVSWVEVDGRTYECRPLSLEPEGPVTLEGLLAPVQPGKVVGVGLNYRDHVEELALPLPQDPIIFLKPASSVIGPEQEIRYPVQSTRVDYEAELGIVIGERCDHVSAAEAARRIFGYTCLNDVTARDLQMRDGQWTRAKSFDTFCPLGPCIVTDLADPHDLAITSRVNGEVRQQSNTTNLIFNVFELVEFISAIMTLEPGDVIATGTPAGIGALEPGDEVEVEIEHIGTLKNRVGR